MIIFACSCGSDVGQLANDGTRQTDVEGKAEMACLPRISRE